MRTIVFSDLDGCLLNKQDYSFDAAIGVLNELKQKGIPLVLASSKTETEMREIASEMRLDDAPLICENGGVLFWTRETQDTGTTRRVVLGVEREQILACLDGLKSKFQFRSFRDLQVDGVAAATDLPREKAQRALQRDCTEPLLWDDSPDRIPEFEELLVAAGLTLTRGGRFWHVAGKTNKGVAMQRVLDEWPYCQEATCVSLAIGDSPIDQGMLDRADYPIAIPDPDGVVHITAGGKNGRCAARAGAIGWADEVSAVLGELAESD